MSETDLSADRGAGVVVCTLICLGAISVVIGLRFWSRALLPSHKFWWDDWIALTCLPIFILYTVFVFETRRNGLGKHAAAINSDEFVHFLEGLYAASLTNIVLLTLPKYSALFFYARAFGKTTRRFRTSLWVIGSLTTLWLVYSLVTRALLCRPPSAVWNAQAEGNFFLGTFTNVALDIAMFLLPIPTLRKLQTDTRRKSILMGIFVLGNGVVGVSIARLITMSVLGEILNHDVSYNTVPSAYYMAIEPSVSVICICVPALFHLLTRARKEGVMSLFKLESPRRNPSNATDSRNFVGQNSTTSPESRTGHKSPDIQLQETPTDETSCESPTTNAESVKWSE